MIANTKVLPLKSPLYDAFFIDTPQMQIIYIAWSNLAPSPPPWMLWQQTLTCHGVMGEEGMRGLGRRKRCCEEQEALSYLILAASPAIYICRTSAFGCTSSVNPLTKTCGDLSRPFGLLSWPSLLRPFHKGD